MRLGTHHANLGRQGTTQCEATGSSMCREVMVVQQGGEPSAARALVQALKACTRSGELEAGIKLHAHMRARDPNELNPFVANTLLHMYATCGSTVRAHHLFDQLRHRNVVSWNIIILAHARKPQDAALALRLYAHMHYQQGVTPNARTFVAALKACGRLAMQEEGEEGGSVLKRGCLEKGRSIHSRLLQAGFQSDAFVGNTLVDMYAKCGSLVDARQVFDSMPVRDSVSWNAIIFGYAEKQAPHLALQLYAQMAAQGVRPDEGTFVAALKACATLATLEGGVVQQIEGGKSSVKRWCLEKGRAIHWRLLHTDLLHPSPHHHDARVGNSLTDMYAKCGSMVEARHTFDSLTHRDVVSWNVMIGGYAEQGQGIEAVRMYAEMLEQGVCADAVTYVSILKACANTSALETGRHLHAHMCSCGVADVLGDVMVGSSLVDMYGKCGSMVDAQRVFDGLERRNLVTWTALISGYARQGHARLALQWLERMREEECSMEPNGVTFVSLLAACSRAGLVDKGQEMFSAMSQKYGITPGVEHHNCMVDLLGRAGQVDEAVAMVGEMGLVGLADVVTWKTVLGACAKWNRLEVARVAFECAVRLDEKHGALYSLMCNVYEDAQMWEERERVQAMREGAGVRNEAGQSWWIEVGGRVHGFVAGDTRHPQSAHIYAKLRDLSSASKLKERGRMRCSSGEPCPPSAH